MDSLIFKILGKVAVETGEAEGNLDKVTDKAEKSESKISEAFKKIGAAVVAYFSIDAIKNFGKACVETAAEVRASTAQFEQTFTTGGEDLTATAKNIIDTVAKSSGILATRLQDSGTKIYAFAKASGADSATALTLMQDALTAAADTAAYYDTSLENATDTLQSFLKGNFANDAALGVSCTETTRNAKAMELFGEKYQDLSEIQKQQTLLKMVTDSQELSGAMGQASREADGWENVMGNLKESWRQFQAVIGNPILERLIPIVKKITEKIQALPSILSDLKTKAQNVGDYLSTTFAPTFDAVSELFVKAKETIQPYIDKISEYVSGGSLAADATNLFKEACELLNDVIVKVVDGISIFFNWCQEHKTTVEILATVIGGLTAAFALVKSAMSAWNAITLISTAVTTAFGTAMAFITSPITLVTLAIGALIAAGILLYKHWDEIKAWTVQTWENIKLTITGKVSEIRSKVISTFENIRSGVQEKIEAVKDKIQEIVEKIKSFMPDFVTTGFEFISGLGDGISTAFSDLFAKIGGWVETNIVQPIKNKVSGFFEIGGEIVSKMWEGITGFAEKLFPGLSKLLGGAATEATETATASMEGMTEEAAAAAESAGNAAAYSFSTSASKIPADAKTPVSAMAEIMDKDLSMQEAGVEAVDRAASDMETAVETAGFEGAGVTAMENFILGINAMASSVYAAVNAIAQQAVATINAALQQAKSTAAAAVSSAGGGSYAAGLDYVPYDEFPATLHKGEAVLTADEADAWRAGKKEGAAAVGASEPVTGSNGITIIQNISSTPQTPVEFAAATAAYFEQARWAMA